jgi:ABC-type transport system involved in multi-copper enzyme maturation permease subunit
MAVLAALAPLGARARPQNARAVARRRVLRLFGPERTDPHGIDTNFTVAGKEFCDRIRNRWVLAVALVFTVFSLVIAYFGGAQQGAVGFRSIEFTIASLVSLVIYLIPLIALLLGFRRHRRRARARLARPAAVLPITRLELLLGKYLGSARR